METIISIISLVIAIISALAAGVTFFWTSSRDRKQATLEAFNRLQAEVFDNLNQYRPSDIPNICKDKKSEEYKKLSGYVARIEHFCVGLNKKIYDKNTFYELAHGYFDGDQIKKRICPIIEVKNSSNNSNELFYNDILAVLAWMDKKHKSKKKKKPKQA